MIEEYWQESLTLKARNCSEYDAYNELFIIYSDGFFEKLKKLSDKENVNFIFDVIFSKNEPDYAVNNKINSQRILKNPKRCCKGT